MREVTEINKSKSNDDHQPQVVAVFALVGMFITGVMGLVSLVNQDLILASALLFASAVYFGGYYGYKKYGYIRVSSAIVLYSLYILMFYLVYSGGVEQTGPLWIFIVAPVSVHLHGLRRGLIDIAVFIVIISSIMFMPTDILAHAAYSTEFKFRLLLSFLTVTFLSGLYEYSREQFYNRTLELTKKYQQLAHFDPLTQLSNRRDALGILKQEQARAVRNKEPFAIILCDVDHFKKINDQYGHNAGDTVLVELAKIFSQNIREVDCVSRWGGEEFLFILPKTSAQSASVIAEKIQAKLNEQVIYYENKKIAVTASMGIEQFSEKQSIDELINQADKFLYLAKDAGRNQIFPKF